MINPAFNIKILQSFIAIFSAKADILLENLNKKIKQPIYDDAKDESEGADSFFDILPYINACSLDMVSGEAWNTIQ